MRFESSAVLCDGALLLMSQIIGNSEIVSEITICAVNLECTRVGGGAFSFQFILILVSYSLSRSCCWELGELAFKPAELFFHSDSRGGITFGRALCSFL